MYYLPKKGEKFNAYTVSKGNLARGCPCVCTREDVGFIYAEDKDGWKRNFRKSDFVFEQVK